MTLLLPQAFYLALSGLLILLLHFLRSRERQRDVSSLLLWEGLHGEPQSKAARLRQQLDPLLLLQLAILFSLVFALAQPLLDLPSRSYDGIAVIIDGSASMRSEVDGSPSKYTLAVDEALSYLAEHAASEVVVIQHSAHPVILAGEGTSRADAQAVLRSSAPTWYGDGRIEDFESLLGSVGGAGSFDRVLYLSDHVLADLPENTDIVLSPRVDNLAITAFSVRENVTSLGVTAFVELTNDSEEYVDAQVRLSDGENQTTLQVVLAPSSADRFSIPFPTSRGTVFTARVSPEDRFAADNERYYSLDRPIDIRVFWIGDQNRYLLTALRAVAPVTRVEEIDRADLVIVEGVESPLLHQGVVLLVNAGMTDVVDLGESIAASSETPSAIDHDLLRAVSAEDFRVRELREATFEIPYQTLIEIAGHPLLTESVDVHRRLLVFTADLMNTNLPITVDFPILVRNIVNDLVRVPSEISASSLIAGDFVDLSGRGAISALELRDRAVDYSAELESFRAESPGIYTLRTERGAYALAVNIPISESQLLAEVDDTRVAVRAEEARRHFPLWPVLTALALVVLILEMLLYIGLTPQLRRTP